MSAWIHHGGSSRYTRSRRLDRKIAILREKDFTWKECLEDIKLITHAPRSKTQNSRMNRRATTYEVSRVKVLLRTAYICTTIACANAWHNVGQCQGNVME